MSSQPQDPEGNYTWAISKYLVEHPQSSEFLQDIIAYVEISHKGWEFIKHIRWSEHDSGILQKLHPELFRVPEDILKLVDLVRTRSNWHLYKDSILARCRGMSLQIPEPRPTSYASTSSSARSSIPLFSASDDSARLSRASDFSSEWSAHSPAPAMIPVVRGRPESKAAGRSLTPSPAVQSTRRSLEPKRCPVAACDKIYTSAGNLRNHIDTKHQDHPQAWKHRSSNYNKSPEMENNTDLAKHAGTPSSPADGTTNPSVQMAYAAKVPDQATAHIIRRSGKSISPVKVSANSEEQRPPVPQKDLPKRPLPFSPTSQVGPRQAQEPERYHEEIEWSEDQFQDFEKNIGEWFDGIDHDDPALQVLQDIH